MMGAVFTAEIEVPDEQCKRMFEVRQLLGIAQRAAGVPASEGADGQIGALSMGR